MRIEKAYKIDFFDVDRHFKMTFKSMARAFQGMATTHSHKVGAGYAALTEMGFVWFLHRLQIEAVCLPALFDEVKLVTWSRGFKGFKGFREYRIQSGSGAVLVKGSSVWLFYNTKRKRIAKVPEKISQRYRFDTGKNFDAELDLWQPEPVSGMERTIEISLRHSDFDINGHVNNTEYVGFLETLHDKGRQGPQERITGLKIKFNREIGQKQPAICAGWIKQGEHRHCRIYNDGVQFADACLTVDTAALATSDNG